MDGSLVRELKDVKAGPIFGDAGDECLSEGVVALPR